MAITHSYKLQQTFYKFLPKEENFLLSIACFPDSMFILRGGGSHEVFPISLSLLSNFLFLLDCMGDFWPSFQGPSCSKLGLRGGGC